MDNNRDPRRKRRSPSASSDDSSSRGSRRKYDRSPSPRRKRYHRSRSRERRSRSSSTERRRNDASRPKRDDWKPVAVSQTTGSTASNPTSYPPPPIQYSVPPPPTSQPPPPQITGYNQGYNYGFNYNQNYEYPPYQQPPPGYHNDYAPPAPNWQGNQVPYNNQQPPPPPSLSTPAEPARSTEPTPPGVNPSAPKDSKKEAIANEVKQQKATLAQQREEYIGKSNTLQRELEILRKQSEQISKESGRENSRILKENQKLQDEIQTKMKTIHNVIDMLTNIIGDKATVEELKAKCKVTPEMTKRSKSPREEFPKGKSSISPDQMTISAEPEKEQKTDKDMKDVFKDGQKPLYNFVYYDPEMHWCKTCDIFPKTAKEYLNHLHTNEHKEKCAELKLQDMPWHERLKDGNNDVPHYPGLPSKRTPIKGLQFFSPSTAWYCKLCDTWIGDLHCASLHLKSKTHSDNYSRFVEQNPHWETDWMGDREKAFSDHQHKQMQFELQKQKEEEQQPPVKSKKSKKKSKKSKKSKKRKNKSSGTDSSSDSDGLSDSEDIEDPTRSIRVTMRNKNKGSNQSLHKDDLDNKKGKFQVPLQENWDEKMDDKKSSIPEDGRFNKATKGRHDEGGKNHSFKPSNNDPAKQDMMKAAFHKPDEQIAMWGPKEPPTKSFWIKKDDEKNQSTAKAPEPSKLHMDEMPKPHMGFWTKPQLNMSVKPLDSNKFDKPDEDRDRDRGDRDRKYDRDDKYDRGGYDRFDNRRGRRDTYRDRDRDYYDDRRKNRDDSPPRRGGGGGGWRDRRDSRDSPPRRNYRDRRSHSRERRDDSSNDESKFDKKSGDSKTSKKVSIPGKKPTVQVTKAKLPFIGRLPLFKKKIDDTKVPEKADIAPLPYQQSKFEDTPRVSNDIMNPPGVVHITKLATPVVNSVTGGGAQAAVSSKPVMKILVAPAPPILSQPKQLPAAQVVDMEIEDQTEDTVIEERAIEQHTKDTTTTSSAEALNKLPLPANPPPPSAIPAPAAAFASPPASVVVAAPPPFIPSQPPPNFSEPPPFMPNRFPRPPMQQPPYMGNHMAPGYMQNHQQQPPQQIAPAPPQQQTTDVADIPEPVEGSGADPNAPLHEDFQETLKILYPAEQSAEANDQAEQESVMYSNVYGMMTDYDSEYMDHPPPEIAQEETQGDIDSQPGPDDLKMLGIDEGDTIL